MYLRMSAWLDVRQTDSFVRQGNRYVHSILCQALFIKPNLGLCGALPALRECESRKPKR